MAEKKQTYSDLQAENARLKRELAHLKRSEQINTTWLQTIIDSIPTPVFLKNAKREFVLCNEAFTHMLSKPASALLGKKDEDFSPIEEVLVFKQKDEEVLANGVVNWNQETHTVDGVTKDIITSKTRIQNHKGEYFVLGAIADITDNKNQHTVLLKKKDEIEQQKKHIQTLLKEVHHRVKNNLQIVNSLLNLQMSKIDSPDVELIISNAKNRIYAMAKIHGILCEGDSLSAININTYLTSLLRNIRSSVASSKPIHFNSNIPNLLVGIEIAVPIGLITNEIITNSIKYGNADNHDFEIYLNLEKNDKNEYELAIGDNGEGVNQKDFKPSLGTELIEVFAEQLEAEFTIPNKINGVHYQFKFQD